MEKSQLKPILESLVFASEEPLGLATIAAVLEQQGVEKNEIKETLAEMTQEYQADAGKGFFLREVGGAWQFVTKPAFAEFLQKLDVEKPKSLSQASLETLSIIAYRQPVVRSDVEQIRGVDSGGVLKTLLERGWIKIVGRREEAGQPLIYGTTPAFLELFHLTSLEELPSMKEIEQIVEEEQKSKTASLDAPAETVEISDRQLSDEVMERETAVFDANLPADDEALADLENSLKDLRKIEKDIFPQNPQEQKAEGSAEGESAEPPQIQTAEEK